MAYKQRQYVKKQAWATTAVAAAATAVQQGQRGKPGDCFLLNLPPPVPNACAAAGLKKKLKDLMGEFSAMRARIHEENRQVVQRRVYTVTGQHLPEEDIDTMIETGELA
jgi:hypothetical protein